jgi:hypothetical protein
MKDSTNAFTYIPNHDWQEVNMLAGFCLSVARLRFSYWVIKTITGRQLKSIPIPELAKA